MPLYLSSSNIPQGIIPDEDEPALHLYPEGAWEALPDLKSSGIFSPI